MLAKRFHEVLDEQISACILTLTDKAHEYATDDRLHNFKVAAALEGCSARQALAGMMAKHSVSLYDMCREDELAPIETWNEKITDHLNYLFLLRALLEDEELETLESVYSSVESPYAAKHRKVR